MSLIKTFGHKVNQDIDTADDLMNWIIFGNVEGTISNNK